MTADELRAYCLGKAGAWPGRTLGRRSCHQGARQDLRLSREASGTTVGVKAGNTRDEADEWLVRYPGEARVMPYIGRAGWNTLNVGWRHLRRRDPRGDRRVRTGASHSGCPRSTGLQVGTPERLSPTRTGRSAGHRVSRWSSEQCRCRASAQAAAPWSGIRAGGSLFRRSRRQRVNPAVRQRCHQEWWSDHAAAAPRRSRHDRLACQAPTSYTSRIRTALRPGPGAA